MKKKRETAPIQPENTQIESDVPVADDNQKLAFVHKSTLLKRGIDAARTFFVPTLIIIVLGLLWTQMTSLLTRVVVLEKHNNTLSALPTKIKILEDRLDALEKDFAQKVQKLDDGIRQRTEAMPLPVTPPPSQSLTQEQFQQYPLGPKQIDEVREALSQSFATKEETEMKGKYIAQGQSLLYYEALKQLVLSGKPYDKILQTLKQLVVSSQDSLKGALLTAFDILTLSSQKGLPSLTELYHFPNRQQETFSWPSWLVWMKDYVHWNTNASKGLTLSEKQHLTRLMDTGQLSTAIQMVTHHVGEHLDLKELWDPWLKATELRIKTLQSLEVIQQFLFEGILS